jgi:protoheme IX farnesyltransferase
VPMLPVVASARRVGGETVLFTWLTVLTSLAVLPLAFRPADVGLLATLTYAVAAVLAGAAFVGEAHRLSGRIRRDEPARPMRLFHWSNTYLTIVFVAVAVSTLLAA